jgi:hypothetical protein
VVPRDLSDAADFKYFQYACNLLIYLYLDFENVKLCKSLCKFRVLSHKGLPVFRIALADAGPAPAALHSPNENACRPGNAVVTIELEFGCKWVQTEAREKSPATMRQKRREASFAQPKQTEPKCRKRPFHGDNTGSNPVGDAK